MGEIVNHFLRLVDFKSAQNVDYFIANSQEVKGRIEKFYRRNSTVIYPPVEIGAEVAPHLTVRGSSRQNYYLCGGRLAKPKNIDLIVKTCTKLGLFLKVFGRKFVSRSEILLRRTGSNIEYLGEVSDGEKLELMSGAKAYIFASEDEDFGITPVEAMSVGTPVIAYKSGGVKETVVDGETGLFFNELTVKSLVNAIKKFDTLAIKPEDCIHQVQKFSKERFKKEIKHFINSKLQSS